MNKEKLEAMTSAQLREKKAEYELQLVQLNENLSQQTQLNQQLQEQLRDLQAEIKAQQSDIQS